MDIQSRKPGPAGAMAPATLAVLKGRLEQIACEPAPEFLLKMAQGSEKTDG